MYPCDTCYVEATATPQYYPPLLWLDYCKMSIRVMKKKMKKKKKTKNKNNRSDAAEEC